MTLFQSPVTEPANIKLQAFSCCLRIATIGPTALRLRTSEHEQLVGRDTISRYHVPSSDTQTSILRGNRPRITDTRGPHIYTARFRGCKFQTWRPHARLQLLRPSETQDRHIGRTCNVLDNADVIACMKGVADTEFPSVLHNREKIFLSGSGTQRHSHIVQPSYHLYRYQRNKNPKT